MATVGTGTPGPAGNTVSSAPITMPTYSLPAAGVGPHRFKTILEGWGIDPSLPQYQPQGDYGAPGTRSQEQQDQLMLDLATIIHRVAASQGRPRFTPTAASTGVTAAPPIQPEEVAVDEEVADVTAEVDPTPVMTEAEQQNAAAETDALFPWIRQLGLTEQVTEWILEEITPQGIVARIRQTPAWQNMFPGFYDENGQIRFNTEADYLTQIQGYQSVLMSLGWYDPNDDNPQDYVALLDNMIDPNELQERGNLYIQLDRGSQQLRDQFYVYAGMDVSTDDLFRAVVDDQYANALTTEYDETVAANPFDYQTYITRATERGLENVVTILGELKSKGVATAEALNAVRNVDPAFAREVMGAIANSGTETMGFDELSYAFQYALIGSAATEQGLTAPSLEHVEQLRAAGVDRARASAVYSNYATTKQMIAGMVERANVGEFTQEDFSKATFLTDSARMQQLEKARAGEVNRGRQSGGFSVQQDQDRYTQIGR